MSKCYAPNAIPIPQYGPCNTSESSSLCCTPGQICLTNGLCANGQGEVYSGACTDKNYQASICPAFCQGTNKFVVQCEDSMVPDGGFCCDYNGSGTCCGLASNALKLAPAMSSVVVASTAGSSQTATSMGPTPSSSITSAQTNSIETTLTHTIPTTITSTLISVSPTATPANEPKDTNTRDRAIGLGIGIPLAVILASVLAIYGFKKLRGRQSKQHPSTPISDVKSPQSEKSELSVHELDSMPSPTPELAPAGISTVKPIQENPTPTSSHFAYEVSTH